MKTTVKALLVLAVMLLTASGAWAQAAGNWQHLHGQVQAVQGNRLTVKADDGRIVHVDMSQVSQTVQGALTPNAGVTITGFPGSSPNRFTARYIEQDNQAPAAAPAATGTTAVVSRVLPLVPQFIDSQEFRDHAARFRHNRDAAQRFATQLYRGFFEREPSAAERDNYADYLTRTGDIRGTVESFMKSPEYAAKNKNERQAIRDLYQSVHGRTPSNEEIQGWQQRIAQGN